MNKAKRLCSVFLLMAMALSACGAGALAASGTVRGDAVIYADASESLPIGSLGDGAELPGLEQAQSGWYKFNYQGLNLPVDGFIQEGNVSLSSTGGVQTNSIPVIDASQANTIPVIDGTQQGTSSQTVPIISPKAKVTLPTSMTLGLTMYVGKGADGIVAMVAADTVVDVLSEENEWTKIGTASGQGYVETKYLRFQQNDGSWAHRPNYPPDPTPTPLPLPTIAPSRKYARVVLPSADAKIGAYPTASGSGSPVASLSHHQIVQMISEHGEWTYVEIGNSSAGAILGYVKSEYLEYQKSDGTWPSDSTPGGTLYAYVNMSQNNMRLNLRQYADLSSAILGQYYSGTQLLVLSWGNEWTQVRVVSDGKQGFMQTKFLSLTWPPSTVTPAPTLPPVSQYAVVNNPDPSDWLNLRAAPSTVSAVLGKYYNGTTVRVMEYGSTWCYVEVAGKIGYMMTRYLSFGGGITPTPTSSTVTYAVVDNPDPRDRLNLRATPSLNSGILGRYYNGTQVKVYERGATWCYVEVNGKVGYMMTSFLSFGGGTVPTPNPGGQYTTAYVNNPVSTQRLNLRASPSINSASLGQYYNGTAVKVYERGATWCYVEVNGKIGYMMTSYLSFSGNPSVTTAVVNNSVSTQRLNLRASASTTSASLGQYYNGTVVQVIEYGATWCHVRVGTLTGYMMTRYLSFR